MATKCTVNQSPKRFGFLHPIIGSKGKSHCFLDYVGDRPAVDVILWLQDIQVHSAH